MYIISGFFCGFSFVVFLKGRCWGELLKFYIFCMRSLGCFFKCVFSLIYFLKRKHIEIYNRTIFQFVNILNENREV
uniref:Uncharacterized protein n=1 Tax=Octopus bimaculoides TaxID=37653 RepID=A0A0L8FTJ0_OCTBM